jgi:hypothetical protein
MGLTLRLMKREPEYTIVQGDVIIGTARFNQSESGRGVGMDIDFTLPTKFTLFELEALTKELREMMLAEK